MLNRRLIPLLIGFFATFLIAQIPPTPATPALGCLRGTCITQHQSVRSIANSNIPTPINSELTAELDAGLAHYDAGRYDEAIETWQSVLERDSDHPLHQALVYIHLSLAHQHLGQWAIANESLETGLTLIPDPPITSEAWDALGKGSIAQGNLLWHQGDPTQALAAWQRAEGAFTQLGDVESQLGSRLNQARALQSLGLMLQASDTLRETVPLLQHQAVSPRLRAAGLQRLGNTYRQLGLLLESKAVLEQSVAIAPDSLRSSILLDLGNTARAMAERAQAIGQNDEVMTLSLQAQEYYQQSRTSAPSALTKAQASVNALSLAAWQGNLDRVIEDWATLHPQLLALPLSRTAIQLQLQGLQTVLSLQNATLQGGHLDARTAQFAVNTLQQVRFLGNLRLEALALAQLSDLYAAVGQTSDAKTVAQKTITLADRINAADIRYRGEWQLGRLLKQQWEASGRRNQARKVEAIAAYNAAYTSLDTVRQDLVGIDVDVQFSFQTNISPLYQELADLLLAPSVGETVTSEELTRAVEVLDSLQRVELENYLRCNLSQTLQVSEANVDPTAAILYPVIFPDRLEVIITLPNGDRQLYTQTITRDRIETLAAQVRRDTVKRFTSIDGRRRSQQLYDWLIRPAQADLAAANIRTLVFVLDSTLRDVPLAALYDGQHYLIEDYALAVAPGLQLLQPAPLRNIDPAVLAFGLSEMQPTFAPHDGFADLQHVEAELQEIEAQVQSQQFINADFSSKNLAEQIQSVPFPIIHLATHGQFSSDPKQTFILTWNERLNIDQISQIFRQRDETTADPVELLVLSACETALGHRRASLGLAGIAVHSGARSTIASLWQVDDQATADLMNQLYQRLSQPEKTVNRAEALRQAQLALLNSEQNNIPAFWAAFVLVGNWL